MFVRVWQFRVPSEKADETIDRLGQRGGVAAFLRAWGEEYAALDRRSESLSVSEGEIGSFQVTAEPIEHRR
jgi:hypothetical protein